MGTKLRQWHIPRRERGVPALCPLPRVSIGFTRATSGSYRCPAFVPDSRRGDPVQASQRLAEVRRSRQSTGGQRSVHLAAATRSARLGSSATLRRQRSSLQGAQGWDERARDPDPSLSAAANRAGCRREQVQGSLSTSWARRCPPRVLRPSRRVGSVRPRSCRRGACLCSAVLCVGGGLVHLWEPGHGGVSKPVICINDVAQDHGPTRSPVSRERTGGSLTSSRVARRRRRRGGCLATDAENGL
jgi:hypothetical protein